MYNEVKDCIDTAIAANDDMIMMTLPSANNNSDTTSVSTRFSVATSTPGPPPLVRQTNEPRRSVPGAVPVPGPNSQRVSSNESLMDSTVYSVRREGVRERSPSYDEQSWGDVLINAVLVDEDIAASTETVEPLPMVEATPMIRPWYTRWCVTSSLFLAICIIIATVLALTTDGGVLTSPRPRPDETEEPAETEEPIETQPPTNPTAVVSVVIQLDDKPEETGWSLMCGGDFMENVLPGAYNDANEMIIAMQSVEIGTECIFTVVDSGRDGLTNGYYEIYLGQNYESLGDRIVEGTTAFVDDASESFVVAPITAVPSESTLSPSTLSPTTAPKSVEPTETAVPSVSPTLVPSVAPTSLVTVTVVIRLDGKPAETSWKLRCDGRTIYNVPPRNYEGQENRLVTVPAHLQVGDECLFTIYDKAGNGLEAGGYFEIFAGSDITDSESSLANGHGDFGESKNLEFQVIPPPTMSPTSSPAPTVTEAEYVGVSLVLQFDKFPSEIGWYLQCGESLTEYAPPSTYVEQYQRYQKTFHAKVGDQCVFRITDSYGDGLCCRFGSGFYQLYVGDDLPSNVVLEGSSFGFIKESVFTIEQPLTQLPSPSPSEPTPSPSLRASVPPLLTLTPQPVAETLVPISVLIKMDNNPEDIGWSLQCDGNGLFLMSPGTYSQPFELVTETAEVPGGATCIFEITDAYGEGLSALGFYRIYLASLLTMNPVNLVHQGRGFGYRELFEFVAH